MSMTYPDAVEGVLRREGLDDPIFLGAGEDAWAFALSDTEAIRIFPHASKYFVSELVHLYDRLQGHSFSFQCPRIHEVRVHEEIVYTIETRLPGRPMEEYCREVDGEARRRVLRNYLEALREVGEVEIVDRDFGGLSISAVWPTAGTWKEFLRRGLETSCMQIGSGLTKEVPDSRRIVSRLEVLIEERMDWDRKSLVHGDAYPGNVLVDEDGEVATILDFGRYSLVGDPRLDVAIAIELTEMAGDSTPGDTEYLRGLIEEDPAAAAYRAWTAVVLASVYRGDSRIVRKCIRTLRETAGRL
ncbi:MAG: aminoglycoside phosphotransferase family protein [Gemmatimonadaceae bacterium]|nr:aminoglycoside phosphotransferase family protein [Gemmatimonadaceae bacterium]